MSKAISSRCFEIICQVIQPRWMLRSDHISLGRPHWWFLGIHENQLGIGLERPFPTLI